MGQEAGGELGFTARNFYKRNKSDGFELHAGGRECADGRHETFSAVHGVQNKEFLNILIFV